MATKRKKPKIKEPSEKKNPPVEDPDKSRKGENEIDAPPGYPTRKRKAPRNENKNTP